MNGEEDVVSAFLVTAQRFGVAVQDVTRDMIRQARAEGAHDVPERAIGNHAAARARTSGLDVPLPPIPKGHHVKGVSTLVGSDGQTKGQWVKTAKTYESPEDLLKRLFSELSEFIPVRRGAIPPPQDFDSDADDLLDVYPMGDPHLGMLSWAPETGHDFDLDIAQRLAEGAIDHLTRGARARNALVLNLGDFFHSDTLASTTTKGTDVDTDSRLFKVLRVGRDLMIYTVDACLSSHERVTVDNRNGNHDKVTSMFLALALEAHYRNDPRVTVNVSPSTFFYHRFGLNLIGATHGDTVKLNELQKIMSVDRRQDWGEVEHCYWYCGHVHHTSRTEDYGCTIETFRTLAPGDAWHRAKGYRSNRDMNRITLHRADGEVSRALVKASALERRYWTVVGDV